MEEGLCLALNCRGLNVLGFVNKEKLYVCVHQLAIELWKAYDTPRVSVQRKMLDIGIKIISGDKAMIRLLRSAGIIENFRATMILFSDAEMLCDALDSSRKKRGLAKHALQTLHLPGDRSKRPEERRAKKFTAKMDQLYKMVALGPQPEQENRANSPEPQEDIHKTCCVDTWALYGKHLEEEALPDYVFDVLLVAEEPAPASEWSALGIKSEMISADTMTRASSRIAHFEGIPKKGKKTNKPNPIQTPSSQDNATRSQLHPKRTIKGSDTSLTSAPSTETARYPDAYARGINTPTLSSPIFNVSEGEEVCSVSSASSRNSHPLQNASSSTSPERFLFLQNSSGSDWNESDVECIPSPPVSGKRLLNGQGSRESASPKTQAGCKRVFATKLRHFAKTTSPKVANSTDPKSIFANHSGSAKTEAECETNSQPSPTAAPLHKTVRESSLTLKRKRGRPPKNKRRRPTALCSFATKKRAMSHTPPRNSKVKKHSPRPTVTNPKISNGHQDVQKWHIKNWSKTGGIKLSLSLRPHVKLERSNRLPLGMEQKQEIDSKCTSHEIDTVSFRGTSEVAPSTSNDNDTVSSRCSSQVAPSTYDTHNMSSVSVNSDKMENLRSLSSPISLKPDTDLSNGKVTRPSTGKESTESGSRLAQLLANGVCNLDEDQASATSSSTSSANQKSISRNSRLKNKSTLEERAMFHFNDLFNFYPPKLVVKEGALVPEHSLSVKKIDRNNLSCLTETHPFFRWSLGTPVTSQSQRAPNSRNGRKRKAVS